jgi:ribosome recycling factor
MKNFQEIIDKIRPELDKVISFLERELSKVRVGRPSISLVEDIEVECFGQKFPLKQLGAISSHESRQILIQPWDDSYVDPIVKAISQSNIQVNPIVDGNSIRISFPPLTEEYRKDLTRLLSRKMEDARQTIRHWRQVAWDEIQESFQEGDISEDDKYRGKDKLQDLIDEYNNKVKEIVEKKEKEIET